MKDSSRKRQERSESQERLPSPKRHAASDEALDTFEKPSSASSMIASERTALMRTIQSFAGTSFHCLRLFSTDYVIETVQMKEEENAYLREKLASSGSRKSERITPTGCLPTPLHDVDNTPMNQAAVRESNECPVANQACGHCDEMDKNLKTAHVNRRPPQPPRIKLILWCRERLQNLKSKSWLPKPK
jgi:hypothetical protein